MAGPPPLLRHNLAELVPGIYRVHIPALGLQQTDHRRVPATAALTRRS
ncbi:hypothetical protein GCM10023224_16120 [Streptomonospora halophila]|uniref:Uncharacterized protein n=1 Tax=Streptomonospora halophila TaxID=427369 RepID=A0ABP9GHZ5_9ACTN